VKPTQTRQLPLDLGHAASLAAEDFLVADCNRVASAWIGRWPDWPGSTLVLSGPAGAGKSHLAGLWRQRSGAVAVSVEALRFETAAALLERGSALLIDPLDVSPGAIPETALLHLLNYAAERGQALLLTATLPPAHWPVALPDLSSRLAALPVAEIGVPDDAVLQAVIVKLLRDRQIAVAPDLPAYLVRRIERSFAAARDLVARLDAAALAGKSPVGLALARAVLDDGTPDFDVRTTGEPS
jgi:chromosomal replication initiation ATPase DnaA